jgi:protein-S-isoprenylcysteine O-methyltransferase Ste14
MIISLELVLRLVAIGIFLYWAFYWYITEKEADQEKPKHHSPVPYSWLRHIGLRVVGIILIFQLLGASFFQVQAASVVLFTLQIVGFLFIVIGVSVAISARKTLGTNWAHAFEYQIKQKQELVTNGVYKYIRHPIYTGLMLSLIGGELLAQSYLVFGMIILVIGGYNQAKSEEKLLVAHFGDAYKKYMKRSKMFLPYLW